MDSKQMVSWLMVLHFPVYLQDSYSGDHGECFSRTSFRVFSSMCRNERQSEPRTIFFQYVPIYVIKNLAWNTDRKETMFNTEVLLQVLGINENRDPAIKYVFDKPIARLYTTLAAVKPKATSRLGSKRETAIKPNYLRNATLEPDDDIEVEPGYLCPHLAKCKKVDWNYRPKNN